MSRSFGKPDISGTARARRHRGQRRRNGERALAAAIETLEKRLQFSTDFAAGGNLELTGFPEFVASADFNEDGHVDLVASAYNDGSLNVLFGFGDGTFDAATPIDLAGAPDHITAGDLNADGHIDLVAVSYGAQNVTVLLGIGDGTFQLPSSYAAGSSPRAAVLGDFNADGKLDIAVAQSFHKRLTILLNNGNGTFGAASNTTVSFTPTDLATGDLNGDGKLDLAAADYFGNVVAVALGNGNGTFQTATTYAVGSGPASIALGDLNGDSALDVVTANYNAGTVSALRGNGNGTFQAAVSLTVATGTTFVAVADINLDGNRDIITANLNSVGVLIGNGNFTFQAADSYTAGSNPRSLVVADFDSDAVPDLAVANQGDNIISLLIGQGEAPPTGPVARAGGPYSVSEEGAVQLSGATSTGTSLTYAWDLDNDGTYGETGVSATRGDETGVTPTFSATGLDGPTSFTVGLQVTDNLGETSTAAATITVTNIAPTLAISGSNSVSEGSTYTLNLNEADPGTDTISQWVITWGDGSVQTVAGNPSSVTHVYADGTVTRTISATATDEDGTYSANTKAVTVNNVAPSLTISGNDTSNEGSTYTLGLAATDPGQDTISSWLINWGDGSTQTVAGNPSNATHVYADGTLTRTISATATDEDGTHSANTRSVTVSNVAPSVTLSGNSSVNEGSSYLLSFNRTDPGTDTISQVVITWGDGSVQTINGNPASVAHAYADGANTFTISAIATDEDGTYATSTKVVTINDVVPTLSIGGNSSVGEDSTYTLSLTRTDPGQDTVSQWIIDWGDGNSENIAGNPSSALHVYASAGSYTISASATDEDGTFNASPKSVSVLPADTPPPVANAGGTYGVAEAGSVQLDGSSSTGADLTYAWDLDNDGIYGETGAQATRGTETGVTPLFLATGLDGPGSYVVNLRVTDGLGATSTSAATISIANVAPTLAISGAASVNAQSTYTLGLSGTDPGQDTISSWLIDWGDGNVQTVAGNPSSVTHVYSSTGARTISAGATDEEGTYTAVPMNVTVQPPLDTTAPTATVQSAGNVLSGGQTTYSFVISYADNVAINSLTLGTGDVLVTGPSGSMQASLVSVASGAGNALLVTYQITAPGGSWDLADNGTYTLSQVAGQVTDTSANPAAAGTLGSFVVMAAGPDIAGNTLETANDVGGIAPGIVRAREDAVTALDRNDYYKFTVVTRSKISVKLYNLTDNAALMLLDSGGNQLFYSNRSGSNHEAFAKLLNPGVYYWRVFYTGNVGTTYRLRYEATDTKLPAGDLNGAVSLGPLQPGVVRVIDDLVTTSTPTKYYSFSLTAPMSVYAKLYNLTENADLAIVDASGNVLQTSNNTDLGMEGITLDLTPATYYVQVTLAGPTSAAYRLRLAQA